MRARPKAKAREAALANYRFMVSTLTGQCTRFRVIAAALLTRCLSCEGTRVARYRTGDASWWMVLWALALVGFTLAGLRLASYFMHRRLIA